MSEVFKTFNKDDVSKRDFKAHKQYTLTMANFSASYRPDQPMEFGNPQASVVPTLYGYVGKADRFTEFNSGSEDLNSISPIPSRSIWDNLWHMYYRNWPEPGKVFCTSGDSREQRELYDTAYVISVPHYMYGDGIHPGTVDISFPSTPSGQTINLTDDKFGNLYNTAYASSSGDAIDASIPPNGTVLYLPFKDLTPYQYMPAYAKTFLDNQLPLGTIKDYGMFENTIRSNRVKVITGSAYGTGIEFTGQYGSASAIPTDDTSAQTKESWSYATISPSTVIAPGGPLDFIENEDFAISFYLNVPTAQQYDLDDNFNYIFSTKDDLNSYSFFASIAFNNSTKKIVAKRRDGNSQTSICTSTTSVNDGKYHHILYQKTGSTLQLYIDHNLESSANHTDAGQIRNNQTFTLGANISQVEGVLDASTNTRPVHEHINQVFRGSLDEFRIYSGSLTSAQVNYMGTSTGTGQNHWGNVFYSHGQIVLTHPSSAYTAKAPEQGTVTFRGTSKITENIYTCNIKANEYNQTLNPSTVENHKTKELYEFTNTDVWNPYITRIGLYNDEGQLLVIGSLSQPMQKIPEYDMTFVVRFDT